MICSLSRLSEPDLKEIYALEKDLNKALLAFSFRDFKPADVTEEDLFKIRELEKRLGITLLAVWK